MAFDSKEDCNGKDAIKSWRDPLEVAAGGSSDLV